MGIICGWSWAGSSTCMKPLLEGRWDNSFNACWGFTLKLECKDCQEASKAHPEGRSWCGAPKLQTRLSPSGSRDLEGQALRGCSWVGTQSRSLPHLAGEEGQGC